MMFTIPEVFVDYPIPKLQCGARDQDCVLAERTGIWSEHKFFFTDGYGAANER